MEISNLKEKPPVRVKLFEKEFQALCQGQEIEVESLDGVKVKMILADIGFDRMDYAVERARSVSRG